MLGVLKLIRKSAIATNATWIIDKMIKIPFEDLMCLKILAIWNHLRSCKIKTFCLRHLGTFRFFFRSNIMTNMKHSKKKKKKSFAFARQKIPFRNRRSKLESKNSSHRYWCNIIEIFVIVLGAFLIASETTNDIDRIFFDTFVWTKEFLSIIRASC